MAGVRRERSRPGCFIFSAILVLFLIGLLVVGDRVADRYAEKAVARRVATTFGINPPPQVDIEGVPFLTQLAVRRYSKVNITADQVAVRRSGRTITLDDFDVKLRNVRPAADYRSLNAGHVAGSTTMTWAQMEKLIGEPVRYAGDAGGRGRVQVDYQAKALGQSVTFTVLAIPRLSVDDQTLHLDEPSALVAGKKLPPEVVRTLIDNAVKPAPVQLPFGLRARELHTGPDGMRFDFGGDNVLLTG